MTTPAPAGAPLRPSRGCGRARGVFLRGSLAAWACAVCLLVSTAPAAALERTDFIALVDSVLKVEVQRRQGGYSLGSGVTVAAERVVTNCHVTRDALAIHVLHRGARLPVAAQRSDLRHDLCLLHVPSLESRPVTLGRAGALQVAQALDAVGYTGGIAPQTSEGRVEALHPYDGAPVIRSSTWFNSGASGGGLFDAGRRLVGVLTFRMRGAAHYYAAPVEWVQALLALPGDGDPVAPAPEGELPYWQWPAAQRPDFLQTDRARDGPDRP